MQEKLERKIQEHLFKTHKMFVSFNKRALVKTFYWLPVNHRELVLQANKRCKTRDWPRFVNGRGDKNKPLSPQQITRSRRKRVARAK